MGIALNGHLSDGLIRKLYLETSRQFGLWGVDLLRNDHEQPAVGCVFRSGGITQAGSHLPVFPPRFTKALKNELRLGRGVVQIGGDAERLRFSLRAF